MNCPWCGAWSSVLATRGSVRSRRCANNHRFSTKEIYIGHPNARWGPLVDQKRRAIRKLADDGVHWTDISKQLNVSRSTIYRALTGAKNGKDQ